MGPDALLCHICPRQPNFSDVSHLLTHVSSKAHLSHYFKLQVRSHQESYAGDLLRQYDRWYKVNDLARLLADRMASKEARKKKPQSKPATHAPAYPGKVDSERRPLPVTAPAPPPSRPSLPDFLDPRLSASYLNAGPISANWDISCTSSYIAPTPPSAFDSRAYSHADYPPPTPSPAKSPSTQVKQERQLEPVNETRAGLQASTWHKTPAGRMNTTPRLSRSGLSFDPFVDHHGISNDLDVLESDKERADEITRLKGVLWPGMDIFDSATEQMRRRRNQKKDERILRLMERTSLCVEPTELIFSPTGILRKQRVISGEVEDNSPLKGESPIPRRRSTRPKRGPLSQTDPNAGRGQDRKRSRKDSGYDLRKRSEEQSRFDLAGSPSLTSPLPKLHRSEGRGESEAFELSAKALERRLCNGFAVFHDEDQKYGVDLKDRYQEHRGFPHGLPRCETMSYGSLQPAASGGSITNLAGRPYFPSGKENIEPLLGSHGRIDPVIGWSSPFLKRRDDGNGCPPRHLLSDSQRVGLGAFDGHDLFTGYAYNPLAVSFPRRPANENHIHAGDTATDEKSRSESGPDSPDATITDIEQDDFVRLYLDGGPY